MKILLVGSGGREHTLAWKLSQSARVAELYAAPGNAGISGVAQIVSIASGDLDGLLEFALSHKIDLTIVGPEAPLVAGIADRFRKSGLAVFGPSSSAARLEGSKSFAKEFMARHQIPTAAFAVHDSADEAERNLKSGRFSFPVVVKADGLAAGKGVFICETLDQALEAIEATMRTRTLGVAGDRVVIEDCLQGEEASFMILSDGVNVAPLVPSQDHKQIFEGDTGPNTGGMGAYSMDGLLSEATQQAVLDRIIHPTIQGMAAEGQPFQGVLFAGLMLTSGGPQVLEFNVRFGDPEAQVILPRMQSDLADLLEASTRGKLAGRDVSWHRGACVCVVVASEGYPGSYPSGKEIRGLGMAAEGNDILLFHAGTTFDENRLLTSGGRVLGVVARAVSLDEAIAKSYEGVNRIHFDGMYYRRDIAAKGLAKLRGKTS